ncbi:receptor-like protein kinase HERK 1 [Phalaenopsis equestris]|uniref:receptor-like protein kinase HERK 1 n=1 Tax=Phalaenopsis equestris TaxID=78828 RepID=UPI0009E2F8E4|nr:receptor-like protein kinase HERK 1 [Phalaenopsis equestris]
MAAEPLVAITLLLLILPFSSPSFSPIFLSCGSSSNVNFTSDTPPRTFTPDGEFLLSSSNSKTDSFSASAVSPLYTTARLFTSPSSYSFEVDPNAFYILRLHFFPFNSTSKAQFTVSAMKRYLLLSSFSPFPSKSDIKEFFLWIDTSTLLLTFSPAPNNLAFINALELILSPPNLINASRPIYITTSGISQDDNFSPQATETLYRVNIGGQLITPANDTLWRTWETDDYRYLFDKSFSVESSTTGRIEYPTAAGLTRSIAPEMVYSTARTLNNSTGMANSLFNLTWSFDVPPGFQYLVRMHFCNCWFPNPSNFYFQVYIGDSFARKNLEPGSMTNWRTMIPFYYDFIADAPVSGPLNVSIEPAANSEPPNALLNGLEIMKLSNSHLSLAGEFGLSDSDRRSHAGKHLFSILLLSIIGGIVTLAVLLFALLLCLRRRGSWRRRRRRRRRRQQLQNQAEEQKDIKHTTSWSHYNHGVVSARSESTTHQTQNSSASPRFNLGLQICFAEVMFATNNFDEKQLIGAGGFGKVYRGVLYDGTEVAVKRAVPGSRQGYPEFRTEIVFLSRIRHRHLVSLIGYCEENSEMILVYEYLEKGTLRSYLYDSDLPCLSWKQRLEICICAARGLHYLHTGYSQSIIHRDLKSTNILLGENFIAKLSDFGLSLLGPSFGETHVSTIVKGTFGYIDPEYFKIMKLTEKSDIYSFGVVLFEVLCARPPIVDHVNLAELALHWLKKGQLEKIVDQRLAGKMNENSLRKFGETAANCLAEYGRDRPSIGDVLWNLEYALQLQVTQLSREPFEDSGIVNESQIAVAESVRRDPSDEAENVGEEEVVTASSSPKESEISTSMVFSQLVTGEGR